MELIKFIKWINNQINHGTSPKEVMFATEDPYEADRPIFHKVAYVSKIKTKRFREDIDAIVLFDFIPSQHENNKTNLDHYALMDFNNIESKTSKLSNKNFSIQVSNFSLSKRFPKLTKDDAKFIADWWHQLYNAGGKELYRYREIMELNEVSGEARNIEFFLTCRKIAYPQKGELFK